MVLAGAQILQCPNPTLPVPSQPLAEVVLKAGTCSGQSEPVLAPGGCSGM